VHREEQHRSSRWIFRVLEWDDARARYPNIWIEGLPRHVMALERQASRLRLGDLIAVYYPGSARHPERSDRYVGLVRVVGLRAGDAPDQAWIDLEPVHRFDPPLALEPAPSRVFMCCDTGWPRADVALFQRVVDAAVAAGWQPREHEREAARERERERETEPVPHPAPAPRAAERPEPSRPHDDGAPRRSFGGASLGGAMRDPRRETWLAVVQQQGDRLDVVRLEPTGRAGLQAYLRDPDRSLMLAEAIGLAFPFGLPLPFAESLMGGSFHEQGWWAFARKLSRLSKPDYLVALQEFREAQGEAMRHTDEHAQAWSPLHRTDPDLGPVAYHGIRMIAEDRSRFAIRPFESAQGKLLLEVHPAGLVRRLGLQQAMGNGREPVLSRIAQLPRWPVLVPAALRVSCLESAAALEAVLAARAAAIAVLRQETERKPEELAPERGEQVRLEGWIYGLEELEGEAAV
jgi:hypothetical protein